MSRDPRIVFITPTWAGDLEHFRVMRSSLEHSPLARFQHYVVVQEEDLFLFEEFRGRPGLTLLSTRDVLPEEVERRRVQARLFSKLLGRNLTRICGSLKRVISWPRWPSYTGWHTQQLCKLTLASDLDCDTAVVIDSDVVVTPHADADDFLANGKAVCFAQWQKRSALRGKVRHWLVESEKLASVRPDSDLVNVYFDTPFVLDNKLVTAALRKLEVKEGKAWWSVLLARPPRRWSEFGYYKAFLAKNAGENDVEWREPSFFQYLYDTSDPQKVVDTVSELIQDPAVHYLTIHSQASGRQDWDPTAYLKPLGSMIQSVR